MTTDQEIDGSGDNFVDKLIDAMSLKNAAALAARLDVSAAVISKIRHGVLPVGASMLITAHEESGFSIAELKAFAGLPPGLKRSVE